MNSIVRFAVVALLGCAFTSSAQAQQFRFPTQAPIIVSPDGQYLGTLSDNQYDPDSVSNPFGEYGNRYSPNSINNPYGKYGSEFSPYSANNPYATSAPKVLAPYGAYSPPALPCYIGCD